MTDGKRRIVGNIFLFTDLIYLPEAQEYLSEKLVEANLFIVDNLLDLVVKYESSYYSKKYMQPENYLVLSNKAKFETRISA